MGECGKLEAKKSASKYEFTREPRILDTSWAQKVYLVKMPMVEIVDHDHCDHDLDSDDDDAVVRANVADFYSKLVNTTAADDRHGFIELMKSLDVRAYREFRGYKNLEAYEIDSCPLDFFGRICGIGAIGCVTALLEGESGLVLDLKLDPELGRCPLHVAANKMSYNVIDLLLRYGARTDLKSKETGTGKGGLLPLSVALEKLSYHESLYDWSPKDSAVKLITKLCLPNMKIPLEVNRLLALNTKRVEDIFYFYAMEGKLIEMAALLIVAWEELMGGSGGNKDIHQHLIEEIASVTRDEIKLMGCSKGGKWVPVFKDKKLVMASALELLEIFERAGDSIAAYVRLVRSDMTEQEAVRGITVLLEENGFILKNKRTAFGYPLQDLGIPFLSRSSHSYAEMNPNTNEMNGAKVALSPLRFFRPGLSPFLKSYRSWFDDPFEKRKTTTQKSLRDLLSAKTYGRFGLLLKRGIRSI